jgi:hypothetical protein
MAKNYLWSISLEGEDGASVEHTVKLTCSFFTGKAIITIDGDEYDISTKPLSLRGTNQMFRLGEDAAVIDFPKKGAPSVTVGGELVPLQK